jgi:hypothetical protein
MSHNPIHRNRLQLTHQSSPWKNLNPAGTNPGLVQSLAYWDYVAAVRAKAGFADHRKFSRDLANCDFVSRN